MKKIHIFLISLLFVTSVYAQTGTIANLTGKQLEAIMSDKVEKEKYLIIDVREKEEYVQGHVRYAINIGVNELEYRLKEIDDWKNKNIVTIWMSGRRSQRAADMLLNHGFKKIFNAHGVGQYNYTMTTKVENVRGKKLQEIVDLGTHFIVDTRSPKDYAASHLKGAVNITVDALSSKMASIPKTKPVAVYCYSGENSFIVAEKLHNAGYSVINALDGTIEYKDYKFVQ